MKTVFCIVLLVAVTVAAPQRPQEVTIVRYDSDVRPDGYDFGYEQSDGSSHQESGQLKNVGTEDEAIFVQGSFSWIAPDGQRFTVTYTADEKGFLPVGEHLPKAA